MENYKSAHYNPETFEKVDIETSIPNDLVKEVKQTLDEIDGYLVTPVMINPDDKSIMFGIMNTKDKSLKYKLSITLNK